MASTQAEHKHKSQSNPESTLGFDRSHESSQDPSDIDATIAAMDSLAVMDGTEVYFRAGDPGYPNSFTRDSLIATALRGDPILVEGQIDYSVRRRGKEKNPHTGEEKGKHHHELPSETINGLSTAYNACDTTAQSLLSIAALVESGYKPDVLLEKYAQAIDEGVAYIKTHVDGAGLFIEDPWFSGDDNPDGKQRKFALKVTYWKDSELNRDGNTSPNYPIVYTVAHFQNARALERIGNVMRDEHLIAYGRKMLDAGIHFLWKEDHFISAMDQDGIIDSPSSDSLEALLYIPPERLPSGYAQKIEQYMTQLETGAGYRAGIPVSPDIDPYHMQVWTHQQALLNAAAKKHNLHRAEEVTRNIEPFIIPKQGLFPEYEDPVTLQPGGNGMQLWAAAAYLYFHNPEKSLL